MTPVALVPVTFVLTCAMVRVRELMVSTTASQAEKSGASTGPVIGHCSPEAADGGPIALVEEGDLIELDVVGRKLNIIGVNGERMAPEEIEAILSERQKNWNPKEIRHKKGVLRLFSEHAESPMKGAYLNYE